ncbi:MAG: RecX family transcriptional regulator [Ignavibacteriae bacterium]|nr:RecX family transcriptional regulator [Ignavibacteriota bacterium]
MIITKITRKKNKKPLYGVHVDGSFGFDVSDEVLLKFSLHVGDTLDNEKVEQIITSEGMYRAQQIAVNYLSYRPRTTKEVVTHLRKKGFAVELARKVAAHLQKKEMINDNEFARIFVRDRLKRKPTGTALLRQQLMGRGIAPNIIERVLHEIVTDEDQQRAAEELASKRLTHARSSFANLEPAKRKRRLFEYLLRRGFSSDIATKTVRTVFSRATEGRAA